MKDKFCNMFLEYCYNIALTYNNEQIQSNNVLGIMNTFKCFQVLLDITFSFS